MISVARARRGSHAGLHQRHEPCRIYSHLVPCRTCDDRHAAAAPRPPRSPVRGAILNLCWLTTELTRCVNGSGAFLLTLSHHRQSAVLDFVKALNENKLAGKCRLKDRTADGCDIRPDSFCANVNSRHPSATANACFILRRRNEAPSWRLKRSAATCLPGHYRVDLGLRTAESRSATSAT